MPLSDTSYRRLSPTINMYGEEEGEEAEGGGGGAGGGSSANYLAPLASIEDLSRVNTPGGSPSPRPRQRHPALEDPNWEPPADPSLTGGGPGAAAAAAAALEPSALTPLHPTLDPEDEGPRDRCVRCGGH